MFGHEPRRSSTAPPLMAFCRWWRGPAQLTHAGFRTVWVRRLVKARALVFAPEGEPTAIVLDIGYLVPS
jgi:hypothetical protein